MTMMDASSREMHEIEILAALDARMISGQDVLKARLAEIPGGPEDYELIAKKAGDLVVEIYRTLPPRQLKHMAALAAYGEAVIRLKGAADKPMQPVLLSDLETLINTVVGSECSMCLKSPAEVKGCELQKALANIASPADIRTAGGSCPYTKAVYGVKDGKYVARRLG